MYEQIQANKPQGATHWQAGSYYKRVGDRWFYWDREWFRAPSPEGLQVLCMTPLSN